MLEQQYHTSVILVSLINYYSFINNLSFFFFFLCKNVESFCIFCLTKFWHTTVKQDIIMFGIIFLAFKNKKN